MNIKPTSTTISSTSKEQVNLNLLHWPSTSEPAKEHCLLLHGFSNHANIWQPVVEELRSSYHIWALDFRGHGDSQWSENSNYSDKDFLIDLQQCHQYLSQKNIHIQHYIGHSLGAKVAILFLGSNNIDAMHQQARSLSILDYSPDMIAPMASKRIRSNIKKINDSFSSPEEYFNILSKTYFMSQKKYLKKLAADDLCQTDNKQWRLKLDPSVVDSLWTEIHFDSDDVWLRLQSIQLPCLLLRGHMSAIVRKKNAQNMLEKTPSLELKNISRAGHALLTDNPIECAQSLFDFLQKTDENLAAAH